MAKNDEIQTVVINGKEVKLRKGEMIWGPSGRGYTRITNIFQVLRDEDLLKMESEFTDCLELIREEKIKREEKKRKKQSRLNKKNNKVELQSNTGNQ